MPKPILPKVSGWTESKIMCYKAHLALRLSIRVLPKHHRPFSKGHWRIYADLCAVYNIPDAAIVVQVWQAFQDPTQEYSGYVYMGVARRWMHWREYYDIVRSIPRMVEG